MVPKSGHGVYQVSQECDAANAAADVLILKQFHCCMGHISPETARRLIMRGFVTGVKLEVSPTGELFFCESCMYAKATCKPVPKVRKGNCASDIGDEVHSDMWGPASVATKVGK